MGKTYYRIVPDHWLGFEVQIWRWWFPIWVQANFSNTHSTEEKAEAWAKKHAAGLAKNLGVLSK